jgi:hypothetical protein
MPLATCRIRCEHHADRNEVYSVEYAAWSAMKHRCHNPANKSYHNYGGRGIVVCDEWILSYAAFLADVGRRPSPKHQLERIDNNGNYEPKNVRWATRTEQLRNTRHNRLLTYNGTTLCIADWAEKLAIPRSMIDNRLKQGWPIEQIFTTPLIRRARRKDVAGIEKF